MVGELERNYGDKLRAALDTTQQDKIESYAMVDALKKRSRRRLPGRQRGTARDGEKIFDHLKEKIFRDDILNKRRRPDGRRFSEIRPITCEVGWLPRTHGSALSHAAKRRPSTTTLGTKTTSNTWTIWKGRNQAPLSAAL
jgi:polyribonucleotide nucleotidyltransferase